ncbi:hypothetical protein [Yeosuana marina]|uniref:hypothetical protein n=1 Tax=Yeosuana marina TaxID=1565536 RepID=UPI0030C83090
MNIDVIVIWFLFVLIVFLIGVSVKKVINNMTFNKLSDRNYRILSDNLKFEMESFQKNSQKIIVIDDLNETLFKRLFTITKELLFLQKLIFDDYQN